ncbi:MAG: inositol monophosphatase, partial [Planctomycetes bacterium]|nr:inositol monophosphatase [Planctomycetota bacterium]
ECLFVTTDVASFTKYRSADALEAFLRLQEAAQLTRTWGDAYGYLLVATGRADLMIDPELNLWDAAAIQPIMEEAGGTFTDWLGEPTVHNREGVATNGHILEETLSYIRGK